MDILEDRIASARKRLPNMTFACCSAEHIPFKKGSFEFGDDVYVSEQYPGRFNSSKGMSRNMGVSQARRMGRCV